MRKSSASKSRSAVPLARVLLRFRPQFIVISQTGIILFSLISAYVLRFDALIPKSEVDVFKKSLWIVLIVKLAAFRLGRLDSGLSRFVGMKDLWDIFVANLFGTSLFIAVMYAIVGSRFPRSVYLIDLLLCFLITAAMRCSARIYHELFLSHIARGGGTRILIYGAGAAGAALVQETRTNPRLGYRVVGFLDDDPRKLNTTVLGMTVIGLGRDAPRICVRFERRHSKIDEIVIAMPSASGLQMREAIANCRAAGVLCKTIPGVGELLSGKVLSSQIREVSVLDLLGREPVRLDESQIRKSIGGRAVMVTGAAGSIGSEISRQIARFGPRRIVLFEQAESDLFRIDNELREKYPNLDVIPAIGDIRDSVRIDEVIKANRVESIFHAAAYKHVPMMERHVLEAVRNNVLGTRNVVAAAFRNHVSEFLMISSDKAVNPTNVMGATKRVAELIVGSFPLPLEGGRTKCVSVRFGNVMGSNGSVVPRFKEQIAKGGPVTVTHPEITRYFMTIPESVQLVLQASVMGKGSEIFVLDMGEAVKIVDLAKNMIRLSGHEPDIDIEVRFTGLRPGEKLFEELSSEGENIISTYHEKIKVFAGPRQTYSQMEEWLRKIEQLITKRDEAAVIAHIRDLVPEYTPSLDAEHPQPALAMAATTKAG